ncbi:MAG: hypothetical protein ACK48P_00290, partial [Holosporales bacterium]
MTEPASKKPLVVLDMDGVILTRNEAYIDYYRELFTKYVKPHLPENFQLTDEKIKKCVTEKLERLKGSIGISEEFSPYGLLYTLSDLLPQGYTVKKLQEESKIENNPLSKLREKINPEDHTNFPQLKPTKDMASVMSLTTYCDVVLLTVSTEENINAYFTKEEQKNFEKIIIVPTSVNFLVDDATDFKVRAFNNNYQDQKREVIYYVADQQYEQNVAKGIHAETFVQITGDVPTDQHLPEPVIKFST